MPVSDAELQAALDVVTVHRRPWPYHSSLPMEELDLGGLRLLLKDLAGSEDLLRPALAPQPRREIAVYRDVLQPLGLDGPARVAAADRLLRAKLALVVSAANRHAEPATLGVLHPVAERAIFL